LGVKKMGLIEDLKTIKKLLTDREFRKQAGTKLNNIKIYIVNNPKTLLKEYWIWYLIILFAFCCGFVLAGAYYQGKCQVFVDQIIENLTRQGFYIP
jgi:hypothetical protein